MARPAVAVKGLSKRYEIGAAEPEYRTLREALTDVFTAPFRRRTEDDTRTLWALKDVSFEVPPGEVIGIIGRNGAGKSTLLKILSKITEPTDGRVEIRGRVASLLEVGTGFHPELTGRENVYLNGAILGMTHREIDRKFDEIVAFSELEKFIDTPVKRYSSGMSVRLAFAVAAHIEPEILILDEVLAVGDTDFQKKCLGKMGEVGRSGRTVLFVSHNLSAVTRLCQRAIVLSQGRIVFDDAADAACRSYLYMGDTSPAFREWSDPAAAPGDDTVRLLSVRVLNAAGDTADAFAASDPITIEMNYRVDNAERRHIAGIQFYGESGDCLFQSCDFNEKAWWEAPRARGNVRAVCHIPPHIFAEGRVNVLAAVISLDPTRVHVAEADAVSFDVVDRGTGDTVRGPLRGPWPGHVRPWLDWSVEAPTYQSRLKTPSLGRTP
jgi:lipopolysaccharide transport system ATP-binding protein